MWPLSVFRHHKHTSAIPAFKDRVTSEEKQLDIRCEGVLGVEHGAIPSFDRLRSAAHYSGLASSSEKAIASSSVMLCPSFQIAAKRSSPNWARTDATSRSMRSRSLGSTGTPATSRNVFDAPCKRAALSGEPSAVINPAHTSRAKKTVSQSPTSFAIVKACLSSAGAAL